MNNIIVWFEIPALDFARAKKFYETILNVNIHEDDMGETKMGFFPADGEGPGGAICCGKDYTPSDKGITVYFNCEEDLQPVQDKIEPAGGKILVPKTIITEEYGYFCLFLDTEGNKTAIWSQK
jgi:hypothetical protein